MAICMQGNYQGPALTLQVYYNNVMERQGLRGGGKVVDILEYSVGR